MKREGKTTHIGGLPLEAYRFEGIVQPFPSHFHNYYVVGLVEAGNRRLSCRGREYAIKPGDMLLFNPGDTHSCTASDGGALDYRSLNLPAEAVHALAGEGALAGFSRNVVSDRALEASFGRLHPMLMTEGEALEREEALLLFFTLLAQRYGQSAGRGAPACREEVEAACRFMQQSYAEHLSLEQLCACSGLSKSTLLRAFTRCKGVTPYRYLQSVRLGRAKALLKRGIDPVEAALQTGFADQSHFTHFFTMYIGLSPAAYQRICRAPQGEGGHAE